MTKKDYIKLASLLEKHKTMANLRRGITHVIKKGEFMNDLCEYLKEYNSNFNEIKSSNDFLFVEIKATNSKSVKKLPYGVFFGFTKNEEDLFKKLDNYRLCFVHIDLDDYVLINYDEYIELISSKRVQYQITLKKQG